jgi:hypothetical protein
MRRKSLRGEVQENKENKAGIVEGLRELLWRDDVPGLSRSFEGTLSGTPVVFETS